MASGLRLDTWLDRPDSLRDCLRPLAIWLGLTVFFAGAIALGADLVDGADSLVGPLLLLLGVSLIGGGFAMDATDLFLDPEIEFEGPQWYFVVGASLLFLVLAVVAFLAALL